MRKVFPINDNWYYKPEFSSKDLLCEAEECKASFEKIELPHTNKELPYNYFSDKDFRFVSCYKKWLCLPKECKGQLVFLDFEGVMNYAQVYVNGTLAGSHKGGYTGFSLNISDEVHWDKENEIAVVVDSTERPDTPPFGGQIDYLTFGGIYREVQLRFADPAHIESVFVKTEDILSDKKRMCAEVSLQNIKDAGYTLEVCLMDGAEVLAQKQAAIDENANLAAVELSELECIALWTLEDPKLYDVVCTLKKNGEANDEVRERVGFRQARFESSGFFLNGQKIKLRGLNRHQSFPYVGYAMPRRVQEKDADILKYDLGLNVVRTSHYPQSRHFLNRCDEIGLLVFEEIPGWQHIGDEEWKEQAVLDVREMILRDRNHPAVILWGVRINESQDDHDFYVKTNETARMLDPTRQTGGVRYLTNSDFLEDVYTMNDFVHDNGYGKYLQKVIKDYKTYDNIQEIDGETTALRDPRMVTALDRDVPYLVTEYCGHMYPSKRFDQEERSVEMALRHARIQNASYGDEHISGAIGWCAFDYNTHADFGSGDKICYHGVMDAYRIPKFAAYVYASQVNPEEKFVLEPATYWTRGDRSTGGVIPLTIFTNCDEVHVYCGESLLGVYYPNRELYPSLPHPPVVVDRMEGGWGSKWTDAEFVGYWKGEPVVRRTFQADPVPTFFEIHADSKTLVSDGDTWDATRVVFSVTDQSHQEMPFFQEPAVIQVSGAGQLIGPSVVSSVCGKVVFWVKTIGQKGTMQIEITTPRLKAPVCQTIEVK